MFIKCKFLDKDSNPKGRQYTYNTADVEEKENEEEKANEDTAEPINPKQL